ncbi:hypothetical protein GCM10022419_110650 [Nonomuraea rosea]|uniref:Protein-arginine deiminase C-terminal domain-containing protein n=1 Tax=Nonomuraea rosea TaxID=638574 RepID=A0ABP6ZFR1_9ACTN
MSANDRAAGHIDAQLDTMLGVHVRWVADLSWAHLLGGEVHCATDALRDTRSTARWWTR